MLRKLGNVASAGLDAVSANAAKEISEWAISDKPGSMQSALESGATQLDKVADALERSMRIYQQTDEVNSAHLRSRGL